jgi:carbonic anhydrase
MFLDLIDPLYLPNRIKPITTFRSINSNQGIQFINFLDIFKKRPDDIYDSFGYYEYDGSLTSPPCEEYVKVYVV